MERFSNTPIIQGLRRWLEARAKRRITAEGRLATEVLDRIMPSRPLVAQHQRTAALHIQLANEIGWEGPSRRAPQSWRGK